MRALSTRSRCDSAMVEAGTLRQLAQRLDSLDQLTEQAFLRLGVLVGNGQQRASELAREASALSSNGENEDAEELVARLQLLTERCALWLDEGWARSQKICAILKELRSAAGSLHDPCSGLSKTVKILQSLRVATRIEAAQSQGLGAMVLGQELQGLSQAMQAVIGSIAERCERLDTLLARAQQVEQQSQEGALVEARARIGLTRQKLQGVAGRCVQASVQTLSLQQHSVELAASFGEIVAALQFQDITRQRLQHIAKTLNELDARLETLSREEFGRLCCLQWEQLRWASDEFIAAVERLEANLQKVAHQVKLLASEAEAPALAQEDERSACIAASLQAVIDCLQQVQTTHLAASQALFAVNQAVGDVNLLSAEIEQQGEEMQLLAQNSAISAAHGAAQGAGLSVISENIQSLARDAGRYAQILIGRCRQVNVHAGVLDDLDQHFGGGDHDLDALLIDARILSERLQRTEETAASQVEVLDDGACKLAEELLQGMADFDVRERFLPAVDSILAELKIFAVDDGDIMSAESFLDDLKRRYTMTSQRQIHRQVMSPDDSAVASDLGDNVELF